MKKNVELPIMTMWRGQAIPPIGNNYKTFPKSLETTHTGQQVGKKGLLKKMLSILSKKYFFK